MRNRPCLDSIDSWRIPLSCGDPPHCVRLNLGVIFEPAGSWLKRFASRPERQLLPANSRELAKISSCPAPTPRALAIQSP